MTEIQPATEGRIVHVRTPGVGHCQPAIVVRNWGGFEPGAINCQIFRDGSNDEPFYNEDRSQLTTWGTSIGYKAVDDPTPALGRTWHWPERV